MSKFNVEFDNSDFIDVVEETNDKIITQFQEGSVTVDRKSAELIYNKYDEILHDETYAQLEAKYLDALNEIDRLKAEIECLNITKTDRLSDWDHLDKVG